MGSVKKISNLLLCAGVTSAPVVAFAAGIVPCGDSDPTTCNWESVVQFANSLLTYMIGLGVMIAGVLIAIAGIKLVLGRGNPAAWSAAKTMLWNVVVGMSVMILAFTIIKVLLTTLGVQSKFRAPGL